MANVIDTLITDRTINDVKNMTSKGLYQASDLNRVETAVKFLYEFLRVHGFSAGVGTVKTDWSITDFPTKDEMDRYLANIEAIRSCIPLYPTTPQTPPDMDALNYVEANSIEQILVDAYNAGLSHSKFIIYAGMIYAGMY